MWSEVFGKTSKAKVAETFDKKARQEKKGVNRRTKPVLRGPQLRGRTRLPPRTCSNPRVRKTIKTKGKKDADRAT